MRCRVLEKTPPPHVFCIYSRHVFWFTPDIWQVSKTFSVSGLETYTKLYTQIEDPFFRERPGSLQPPLTRPASSGKPERHSHGQPHPQAREKQSAHSARRHWEPKWIASQVLKCQGWQRSPLPCRESKWSCSVSLFLSTFFLCFSPFMCFYLSISLCKVPPFFLCVYVCQLFYVFSFFVSRLVVFCGTLCRFWLFLVLCVSWFLSVFLSFFLRVFLSGFLCISFCVHVSISLL